MGEHAKYGGSTIKRTKECSAWVHFCAQLPNDSSEWADEGTLCHKAMERIFSEDENFDARSVIGMVYKEITLTEERYRDKIIPAIEAVEDIFERYDIQDFALEARVTIADDIWGTADLLGRGSIEIDGETLTVGLCLDHKFGSGVMVAALDNDQGLFYSVGAAITPDTQQFFKDIDLLVIAVVQPNDRGGEDFSTWEVDPEQLEIEEAEIRVACANSKDLKIYPVDALPHEAFKTGDHCLFCPGKGLCPPTSGEIAAMRRLDVTAPNILENFPPFAELKRVIKNAEALLILAKNQMDEGVEIPNFGAKLVPKQARRSYIDIEAAEAVAKKSKKLKREEVYSMVLLTPPQMEKMLKAKLDDLKKTLIEDKFKNLIKSGKLDFEKLFGPLVQKVSSGTTLASEDDPREAAPGMGALKALLAKD